MRIVIVGASGNVGTALLRALSVRHPNWELIGVIRRRPPSVQPYAAAAWRTIDVAAPQAGGRLEQAVRGADAAVNLAWAFQPTRDSAQLERVGVGGVAALTRAAASTGLPHLVHMSSVGAYRGVDPGRRVDENWPTDGVPSSVYSRHKVLAERLLDDAESSNKTGMMITRFRPGLVLQREAGSGLLRYGVPAAVPAGLLRVLPLLPLDRSLVVPVVHADDVAAAVVSELERRVGGPFNLAGEPPISRDDIADGLHAKPIHVSKGVLRTAAACRGVFVCSDSMRDRSTSRSHVRCWTVPVLEASSTGNRRSPRRRRCAMRSTGSSTPLERKARSCGGGQ